ncbi:MAG TPA: NAD(P)-binding domain-containing protein [Terriglobales bacterium]|nr:NAD(P)-binding domain-containing protein [Terriglobales bacterium]
MIPAVVLGGNLGGLGVVRSLAGGGMPIFVVDKGHGCPAAWSRFARFVNLTSVGGSDLVKELINLSIRIGERPVLILTTDADVNTVSAFRKELEPFFRFTLPGPEMVQTLYDKAQFQLLAEREGLSVPRGAILANPSEFALIRTLAPPLAIKPADKAPLVSSQENDRPVRVEDWDEATVRAAKMMEKAGRLAVQEWIEGDDSDIYFSLFVCSSEGEVLASFAGRKLVCFPPAVGITAVCAAAPEMDEELARLTWQFAKRVGYKGIGSLEFKKDRRTGRLLIIEPTVGRIDWQEEIATLCGVNIPLIAYRAETTGIPVRESATPTSGMLWRSSVLHRLPAGIAPQGASLRDGYFRLNDPLPGLYYYAIELFPLATRKVFRWMVEKGKAPGRVLQAARRNKLSFNRSHRMSISNTVIVGAGPYGLSIAAHLKAAGIPCHLYGTPLESWRKFMPQGMVLKSERFASNLWDPRGQFTLERYSAEHKIPYQPAGEPLSLVDFLRYAEWFRERAVGEPIDVKVTNVQRTRAGFLLDFAGAPSIEARRVVLATGHMAFRVVPQELADLPEPLCYHSAKLRDFSGFAGRDVTLIGAGQSALESAALLSEAGAQVRLIVRDGQIRWNAVRNGHRSLAHRVKNPESGLGFGWESFVVSEMPQWFRRLLPTHLRHRYVAKTWGPSGAYWLRQRVEGRIEVLLNSKVCQAKAEHGRVCLEVQGPQGIKTVQTDHVIAATGYKTDLDRLDYLGPDLKQSIAHEGGAPVLDSQFETSVPGLFIVGMASAPTFGPVMRFMFGAKHVAPVLADRLRTLAV